VANAKTANPPKTLPEPAYDFQPLERSGCTETSALLKNSPGCLDDAAIKASSVGKPPGGRPRILKIRSRHGRVGLLFPSRLRSCEQTARRRTASIMSAARSVCISVTGVQCHPAQKTAIEYLAIVCASNMIDQHPIRIDSRIGRNSIVEDHRVPWYFIFPVRRVNQDQLVVLDGESRVPKKMELRFGFLFSPFPPSRARPVRSRNSGIIANHSRDSETFLGFFRVDAQPRVMWMPNGRPGVVRRR